jgi:hypothetical protein
MSSFDKLTLAEQAQCSLIAMEAVEACGVSKRYHYMQYERVKMKEADRIVASKPKPPLSVVAGANAFFGDGFRVGDIKSSTKTTHTHHDAPDLVEAAEGRHLFSTPEANPEAKPETKPDAKPEAKPTEEGLLGAGSGDRGQGQPSPIRVPYLERPHCQDHHSGDSQGDWRPVVH